MALHGSILARVSKSQIDRHDDNHSMSEQRCMGCARETRVGTSLFPGCHIRKHPKTGDNIYVCASCLGDGGLEKEDFGGAFLRGAELGDIAR